MLTRTQTKLPIPDEMIKRYTSQLDIEQAKKVSSTNTSSTADKANVNEINSLKRIRSMDEVAVTPKRMKSEVFDYQACYSNSYY